MKYIILALICMIFGWYEGRALAEAYISGKFNDVIGPILIGILWVVLLSKYSDKIEKWLDDEES